MEQALADALAEVKAAFARYPKPLDVEYCHCPSCFTEADMAHLFSIPTERLMADDLEGILFSAFNLWGKWPDLAYYVPRLLELSVISALDGDFLLYKLLIAAGAVSDMTGFIVGPMMSAEERQAIFHFEMIVTQNAVETMEYPYASSGDVTRLLAFLAAFHQPLAPFLKQWRRSDIPLARANLCAFMADYMLNDRPRNDTLKNTYTKSFVIMPENQAALDELLSPASVADYLTENAGDVRLLGQAREYEVGLAFDWAMQKAQSLES